LLGVLSRIRTVTPGRVDTDISCSSGARGLRNSGKPAPQAAVINQRSVATRCVACTLWTLITVCSVFAHEIVAEPAVLRVYLPNPAATSVAFAKKLRNAGIIGAEDVVVCNLTGHGLKQAEAIHLSHKEFVPIAPTLAALREQVRNFQAHDATRPA